LKIYVSLLITIRIDLLHMCLSSGCCTCKNFHSDMQNRYILYNFIYEFYAFLTDRKWPQNGIINTENTVQWLVAGIQMGIIITFLECYGKMWDKCASSVLTNVCRTHLSHFQSVAKVNVYEHIGHTLWDKCAPRQMCSYNAG
jgi:hypothetical protein